MIVLNKQNNMLSNLLGEQKILLKTRYRLFNYIKKSQVSDGTLLYNILTSELLLLLPSELSAISEHPDSSNDSVKILIKKRFLVPIGHDDIKLVYQVENLLTSINSIYTSPTLNSFTILPTTDCNARCFYCFEKGITHKNMTEQTAHDVAKFIAKRSNGNAVIRWFGGEPLYNSKAIDIICADLSKIGVDFYSTMITNGYLFSEEMMRTVVSNWKLKKVQITLDGTEKIYNRIKSYIYNGISPFVKVIDNIKYLLNYGVKVNIRLNMDEHNIQDLFELTNWLIKHFEEYDNVKIYVQLLSENSSTHICNRSNSYRHILMKKRDELQRIIEINGRGIYKNYILKDNISYHCMADNNNSAIILPDGNLGKCETCTDSHIWGSIYSDKIDFKELNWFKKMVTFSSECDKCYMRPRCIFLQGCSGIPLHCDDDDKMYIDSILQTQILDVYNKYKENF